MQSCQNDVVRFLKEKIVQIVDSKTVLAMINKLSHRFHVYEGVRIGEVQSATDGDMSDWVWMEGEKILLIGQLEQKIPMKLVLCLNGSMVLIFSDYLLKSGG